MTDPTPWLRAVRASHDRLAGRGWAAKVRVSNVTLAELQAVFPGF